MRMKKGLGSMRARWVWPNVSNMLFAIQAWPSQCRPAGVLQPHSCNWGISRYQKLHQASVELPNETSFPLSMALRLHMQRWGKGGFGRHGTPCQWIHSWCQLGKAQGRFGGADSGVNGAAKHKGRGSGAKELGKFLKLHRKNYFTLGPKWKWNTPNV